MSFKYYLPRLGSWALFFLLMACSGDNQPQAQKKVAQKTLDGNRIPPALLKKQKTELPSVEELTQNDEQFQKVQTQCESSANKEPVCVNYLQALDNRRQQSKEL